MSLRNRAAEEEDAAQVKLGPDFNADNAGCLSTSEVKFLLEERDHQPDNPVFKKTLEYVTTFSRFHDQATNSKVRDTLKVDITEDASLEHKTKILYEMVQIANLCPLESEEAKALIPSLADRDDDELQAMLNELARTRKFQM